MTQADRFTTQPRVVLPGSEKAPYQPSPEALPSGAAVADIVAAGKKTAAVRGQITVTVVLKAGSPLPAIGKKQPAPALTRAAFKAKYGPARESSSIVRAFARAFGLEVAPGAGPRMLQLSGSAAAVQKAFGVTLGVASGYRVREGAILLPEELIPHIDAVLGLDNRPQAQAHFRVRPAAAAQGVSYTPVQVAALYGLPASATANGQTIGIIELGGGYRAADLKAYFASLNLPVPAVSAVSVDKGKNKPGNANGADGEVMLDIEVCGAVAVGAKIVVYFAPNTDQGFIDAIATAVHDTKNKPSVISISWGGPESSWTAQATAALDSACQAAAALGVSITVASGDNGSTDGVAGGGNNVDFPASSPHVLACGGTKLTGSGATISAEVVWNELAANEGATGGGISAVFARPAWQSAANVPAPPTPAGGRGVPDVAGNADPATGYLIRVDGQTLVIGGTSAVAPLWAGLIAVANAAGGKTAGFLNPALYTVAGGKAFHDITSGSNGGFSAGPGWDPCTGLGSPNAAGLMKLLG